MEKIFKKVSRQPAGALTTYAHFVWFALFFSSAFTRAAAADSSVCVAASHTCVIRDDFTTVCFGGNDFGQLGQGNTAPIGDGTDSNSDSFGDVAFTSELGDNLVAVDLGTDLTAKSLACGSQHTCAVLSDDTIKCWGLNDMGQLGQGSKTAIGDGPGDMGDALVAVDLGTGLTAKSVSGGSDHTCAVLSDATIKCWGDSGYGQLGQGNTATIGDGADEMGDNLVAVDLGTCFTAKSVSCGGYLTCAVLNDDSLKCWGSGHAGQIGEINIISPIWVADDCTYCISQVPTLFAHTRLTLSFIYRKILLTITQSATKPTTWATTWVSSLSASVALS